MTRLNISRRRALQGLAAIVGIGSTVGTASARGRQETYEAVILTVDNNGDTGTLERTSDNTEFNFSIPNGSSITVNPGDLVQIILAPTGDNEKRAIVIDTGSNE